MVMKKMWSKRCSLFLITLACIHAGYGYERSEGATSSTAPEERTYDGTIVAVGDSLTAGLGVDPNEAYPSRLEQKLREAGYRWRVVNAGISGETSSGTLSRINWVLKLKPDIVILETGANDGLRGIDPALTRKNIDRTVETLLKAGVIVVLAGMRMVPNLGPDYVRAFSEIYPAAARKYGLILIPFFLDGVAGVPALNQADGIHPTAQGYRIVTDRVYPYLRRAINARRSRR